MPILRSCGFVAGIFGAIFFADRCACGAKITSAQFSGSDPVITFETGSTGLPSIPGLTLSGGDSTFAAGGFGNQIFGNINNSSYLDISFSSPVQAVGAYAVNDAGTSTTNGVIEVVYDQSNDILESESVNFN